MMRNTISSINHCDELRFAFQNAMKSRGLLRLAFIPTRTTGTTYLLRAVIVFMAISLAYSLRSNSAKLFFLTIGLEILMFFLAELEIQRGVAAQPGLNSAVHKLSQQPWRLRRSLMRYAYFCDYVQTHQKLPSVVELDLVLQFIETNRDGRPPAWTNFFRHPLIITMLGIFVYTFNSQIVGSATPNANWTHFALVSFAILIALVIAGMIYTFRYLDPNEDWQFECCLRWYRAERESKLSKTALNASNTRKGSRRRPL